MLFDVLLELFYFVYLLAFELPLFLGNFLLSNAVDVLRLVFARVAAAPAIAEVAVFEALAVAVEATLTIIATSFGVSALCLGRVAVEELLQQLLSQLLVLACSSTFLAWLALGFG